MEYVGTDGTDGARGAGRWNIGVTSLPTTSSEANTAFNSAIGTPVDKDQAWFYTGTVANPTSQGVWIYNATSLSWLEQVEVIDGNLLVSGTVTANAMDLNSITAANGAIADLTVSTIKIQDQAVTFTSFIKINAIYNVSSTTAWTNVADIVVPRTALVPGMVVGLFTASHATSGGSTVNRSEWIEFDAEVVLVTGSTISTLASVTSIRVDGFNTASLNVTGVVSHTSSGDQTYRLRVKKTGGSAVNAVIVTPSLEVTELKK